METGKAMEENSDINDVRKKPVSTPPHDDPLKQYVKEIRKIPVLSPEEEQKYARILHKNKNEKTQLLYHVVELISAIQDTDTSDELLEHINNSLFEYINLTEATALYKKIKKVDSQIKRADSRRQKQKLGTERAALKSELMDLVLKINIRDFNKWKLFIEQKAQEDSIPQKARENFILLHKSIVELERIEPALRQARHMLIKSNLRLVVSICRHYYSKSVPFRDIVQEGNLGLIKAVERFDYKKGFRLNTYASWWIREGISRAIEEKGRVIRLPVYVNEKFYKIKRVINEALKRYGENISIEKIAEKLDMTEDEVTQVLYAFKDPFSLDTAYTDETDPMENFIADDTPSPIDAISNKLIKEMAAEIVEALPEREATILKLRFGLGKETEKTLEEVGEVFGISRERVRQIENRALKMLRKEDELKKLLSLLGTS